MSHSNIQLHHHQRENNSNNRQQAKCFTTATSSTAANPPQQVLASIGNIEANLNSASSSGSGGNSVPAILSRKRKADCISTEEMNFASGSENLPLESQFSRSSFAPQSSSSLHVQQRVPLQTLHRSNANSGSISAAQASSSLARIANGPLRSNAKSSPSRRKRLSPKSSPKAGSGSQLQQPHQEEKRLRLRQSWAEFREYINSPAGPEVDSRRQAPIPPLKWADRAEMWKLICKKETGMYRRLDQLQILRRHQAIQPRMRAILLDWLIEVCEVYKLHRETFYLAVDFIDRYLSVTEGIPKTRLQLLGVSCLFIAAKIEEIYPPKITDFAYVTDGACNEEEILTMELVILKELNWGLSPMTPNGWMKLYMQVTHCDRSLVDGDNFVIPQFSGLPFLRVMQLLDLCVLDMASCQFRYSVLAASAFYYAHSNAEVGRQRAADVSGYLWEELATCVQWMSPFFAVIRSEAPIQPKSFQGVKFEHQHNIQSHTVDLTMLDKVHEKMQQNEVEDEDDEEEDLEESMEDVDDLEQSERAAQLERQIRAHQQQRGQQQSTLALNSSGNSCGVTDSPAEWYQRVQQQNQQAMTHDTPPVMSGDVNPMMMANVMKDADATPRSSRTTDSSNTVLYARRQPHRMNPEMVVSGVYTPDTPNS